MSKARNVAIVVAACALFAAGFGAGRWTTPEPSSEGFFGHPNRPGRVAEDRVISLVVGQRRPSDGLTYGEFAKLRRLRECPRLDAKLFEFVASGSGPFPPTGVYVWDVYLLYNYEKAAAPCPVNARLATVYSDTAAIEPVDSEVGSTDVTLAPSGTTRGSPPPGSAWLEDFRTGKVP